MIRHPKVVRTSNQVDLQFDIANELVEDANTEVEDAPSFIPFDTIKAEVATAYESTNHKSKEQRVETISRLVYDLIQRNYTPDGGFEIGVLSTICWLFCEDCEPPFDVDDDDWDEVNNG